MKVTKYCPLTRKNEEMEIPSLTPEIYERIKHRHVPIQEIAPHLSADEREFLISGITPSIWQSIFG